MAGDIGYIGETVGLDGDVKAGERGIGGADLDVYCTCRQEIESIGLLASLYFLLQGLTHLFAQAGVSYSQQ